MADTLDEAFAEAVSAHRDGRLDEAERGYLAILEQRPNHAASLANLGRIAKSRGRIEKALELYQQATRQPDATPEAFFNLGVTWLDLDRPQEAQETLRECAARAPGWLPVQRRLGLLLLRQGDAEQALVWLRKAVQQDPNQAELWHALGQAAEQTGDIKAAAGAYRRATALAGKLGEAGVRLARLLWENDRREASLDLLRKLVGENPGSAESLANLGYAAIGVHRYAEALRCYGKVVEIDPGYPDAKESIAKCLLNLGKLDEAYEIFEVLTKDPGRGATAARAYMMALLYDPKLKPKEKLARHKRLTKTWTKGIKPLKLPRRATGERLRVGYLTADLAGSHPVAQFVRPLLRAHREHRIDSVAYFNGVPAKLRGEALAGLADIKAIGDLDDHDLARAIAGDGLDLLVDLSGHTQGTRLAVMAYRPAPVQACFVGYPHSTGFKPVDVLIADPVVVPQGAERLVSEAVARLPHAFLCFVPPHDMPQPHPRQADGPVVFGSLNHLPKVTAPTLALWAEVLQAVPDSRLLMKCAAFGEDEAREPYRRRFADLGIADDRLTFEGPEPFADAMRAYDRIDIALDTLPYNGGTTTCHALWMGVPVVTLEGGNFCGRMGASFLAAAGFPELVASDKAGFVDIATRLAADRVRLDALKAELREKVPASPLCDIETYAGDVAALYRKIVTGRTDDN